MKAKLQRKAASSTQRFSRVLVRATFEPVTIEAVTAEAVTIEGLTIEAGWIETVTMRLCVHVVAPVSARA